MVALESLSPHDFPHPDGDFDLPEEKCLKVFEKALKGEDSNSVFNYCLAIARELEPNLSTVLKKTKHINLQRVLHSSLGFLNGKISNGRGEVVFSYSLEPNKVECIQILITFPGRNIRSLVRLRRGFNSEGKVEVSARGETVFENSSAKA